MKIKPILCGVILLTFLTGCIVKPAYHPRKVKVIKSTQVITILDKEHHTHNIVIVNNQPDRKRQCWTHKSHWHCHK